MGKGGGGGYDTSGLEQATAESNALNKQIYEEGREDSAPWYQMGSQSVSKLSDLLGLVGGSMQSRDDVYSELLPQYQNTTTTGGDTDLYRTSTGQVLGMDDAVRAQLRTNGGATHGQEYQYTSGARPLSDIGINPFSTSQSTTTTDTEGLNSAIAARMAGQETPEGYGSLLERFDETKMKDSAGYKYRMDEANTALERQMAAQGVTLGGGGYGEINPQAYEAMQAMNQGMASQEYNNEYNRYVGDQLNTFNMLMGASGSGQQATGQMQQGGQNYANAFGQNVQGLASAQQNAQLAEASKPSMFSQLLDTGKQLGTAAIMAGSDIRIKENIIPDGIDGHYNMYQWNYIGDGTTYRSPMAQEVELIAPDAVVELNGVKHIHYNMIDAKMTEVN